MVVLLQFQCLSWLIVAPGRNFTWSEELEKEIPWLLFFPFGGRRFNRISAEGNGNGKTQRL